MKNPGVLLHISSLPSQYGIGDFGPNAYQFVDHLAEHGFKYWQILPLNQTGYGNSPYNPISAFALNPYLISPELLYEDGLIDSPDLAAAKLPKSSTVNYEAVYRTKTTILNKASSNFLSDIEIYDFIESNALYMKPYLAYLVLNNLYGDSDWTKYRREHRTYSSQLYETLFKTYRRTILNLAGIQAIAKDQLHRMKDYMNSQGLSLIGDIPLYLSYHSSEVWANQHLFELDQSGNRLRVAGVPPDAFSETGQLWGNPLYKWDAMREDGFQLFIYRLRDTLIYLDKLRLDHFIGYVNYWAVPTIPEDDILSLPSDAIGGSWTDATPENFFSLLSSLFPKESFIAEDLGILNEKVCRFRDQNGYPGMIILQFCFEEGVPNVQQYPQDKYIYTGTHDNPPVQEWYKTLPDDSPSKSNLSRFIHSNQGLFTGLGLETEADIEREIHTILCLIANKSGCTNVILPVQDLIGSDASTRMNIPGTALGNWQWRLKDFSALIESKMFLFYRDMHL